MICNKVTRDRMGLFTKCMWDETGFSHCGKGAFFVSGNTEYYISVLSHSGLGNLMYIETSLEQEFEETGMCIFLRLQRLRLG